MFYVSHNIKINLDYLKNKLKYSLNKDTSDYTIDDIKELLKEKFEQAASLINNDDFQPLENSQIFFIFCLSIYKSFLYSSFD